MTNPKTIEDKELDLFKELENTSGFLINIVNPRVPIVRVPLRKLEAYIQANYIPKADLSTIVRYIIGEDRKMPERGEVIPDLYIDAISRAEGANYLLKEQRQRAKDGLEIK